MRKSKEVQLALLTAAALSITGCRKEHRDCVDDLNRILPESSCQSGLGHAHFLYGGASGGRIGDTVVGGRAVSRGGFGGHASGGE